MKLNGYYIIFITNYTLTIISQPFYFIIIMNSVDNFFITIQFTDTMLLNILLKMKQHTCFNLSK